MGTYTHVVFDNLLQDDDDVIEAWISLPRSRRQKWWGKIEDPVVRLQVNLYGHPLVGLYWEHLCTQIFYSEGWEKV